MKCCSSKLYVHVHWKNIFLFWTAKSVPRFKNTCDMKNDLQLLIMCPKGTSCLEVYKENLQNLFRRVKTKTSAADSTFLFWFSFEKNWFLILDFYFVLNYCTAACFIWIVLNTMYQIHRLNPSRVWKNQNRRQNNAGTTRAAATLESYETITKKGQFREITLTNYFFGVICSV